MTDPFSSEQAEEQEAEDYETLEEYIFNTERDHDKEISKSIRFREWQQLQLRIIKQKIGTNAVEVVARSYLMGLARIRDAHEDDIGEMSEILVDFLVVVGNDPRDDSATNMVPERVTGMEFREPEALLDDITEPNRYQIRQSAVSEVEDTYADDAFFGPWIHRYVAALGFLESQFVTEATENKLSSFSSAVAESVDEARNEIESMIMDYISMSQAHWIKNGFDQEMYDKLQGVVEKMETERKETCEQLLENSKQFRYDNEEDNNE